MRTIIFLSGVVAASGLTCYSDMATATDIDVNGQYEVTSSATALSTGNTATGSTCKAWSWSQFICVGVDTTSCDAILTSSNMSPSWGNERSCSEDKCNSVKAYTQAVSSTYFGCVSSGTCQGSVSGSAITADGCIEAGQSGCSSQPTTTTEEPKCDFTIGGMSRSDLTCASDTCTASDGDYDTMDNQCTCDGEFCDKHEDSLCQCLALKGGCGTTGDDPTWDGGVNNMQMGQVRELCPGSCAWVTDGYVNPTCHYEKSDDTTKCLLGGAAMAASSLLL